MPKKLNIESFISKAQQTHGDKYDYSQSIYINSKTPLLIVCPVHGAFIQRPNDHVNGHGCDACGGTKKRTMESFVMQAKQIHNNKYDYSKAVYFNGRTPIVVICPIHGSFTQSPDNHLSGRGCQKCGTEHTTLLSQKTTEQFIKDAVEVHGLRYDYSQTVYTKSKAPIKIICREHGLFLQRPNDHLFGKGCSICAGVMLKTTEQFVIGAQVIHGNKYDYSKVDYISNRDDVTIICDKHGPFCQAPKDHLRGNGCPGCRESRGEKRIFDLLVKMKVNFRRQHRFESCKHKRSLPFDFVIFTNHGLMAIEYQGRQHYEICNFANEPHSILVEKLKQVQQHDAIKRKYCQYNDIPLLEINYKDIDNIENIIVNFLG